MAERSIEPSARDGRASASAAAAGRPRMPQLRSVAQRPAASLREKLLQAVGGAAHRRTSARRAALVAAQQPRVAEARASTRAAPITAASAATSARPRFRPWPASGCTVCAASPSSTQPGPHQGRASASSSGQAARSLAQREPAAGAAGGLLQRGLEAGGVERHAAPAPARRASTRPARTSAPARACRAAAAPARRASGTTGARCWRAAARRPAARRCARVAVGVRSRMPTPSARRVAESRPSHSAVSARRHAARRRSAAARRAARSAPPRPARASSAGASTIQASSPTRLCQAENSIAAPSASPSTCMSCTGVAACGGSASHTFRPLEQRHRRRVERVGAHVGSGAARPPRRGRAGHQRDAQADRAPATAPACGRRRRRRERRRRGASSGVASAPPCARGRAPAWATSPASSRA